MIKDFEPKSRDVVSYFFFDDDEGYTYEVYLGTTFESTMYLSVWRSPDSGYIYAKTVNQLQYEKIKDLIKQNDNKNNKELFEKINLLLSVEKEG